MIVHREGGLLPDLSVTSDQLTALPSLSRVGDITVLTVTVTNVGPGEVAASEISLGLRSAAGVYTALVDREPVASLAVGEQRTQNWSLDVGVEVGAYRLIAVVDPWNLIDEANEENNRAEIPFFVVEPGAAAAFAMTDKSRYHANDLVLVDALVVNSSDTLTGTVTVSIEDSQGFPVADLTSEGVTLEFGESWHRELDWSTAGLFAGTYRVVVLFSEAGGDPIAQGTTEFVLLSDAQLATSILSDRTSYTAGQRARLTTRVDYLFGNSLVPEAQAHLTVETVGGVVLEQQSKELGTLLPGASVLDLFTWDTSAAPDGSVRAIFDLSSLGTILASSSTQFEIEGDPAGVVGSLGLPEATVTAGLPFTASFTITNETTTSLTNIATRLVVVPAFGSESHIVAEFSFDLPPGVPVHDSASVPTDILELGHYLLRLEAELPLAGGGSGWQVLDSADFTTVDRTPPALAIEAPIPQQVVGADFVSRVSAADVHSNLESVEVEIDAGAWSPTTPSAEPGIHIAVLSGLPEGDHSLRARAEDTAGQQAVVDSVPFVVDLTPPLITITGVVDGESYDSDVVPLITIEDLHPQAELILLDGLPFVSGTPVSTGGTHQLLVTATDQAGNNSFVILTFQLSTISSGLSVTKTWSLVDDADDSGDVGAGDTLGYAITVTSLGAEAASSVRILDLMPQGTTGLPGSVTTSLGLVIREDPLEVNVGDLGIGEQAVIEFQVIVDADLPPETLVLSNQAFVTELQLGTVLSDDPATPELFDPTLTPIGSPPTLSIAGSSAAESDAATNGMIFEIQLEQPSAIPVTFDYVTVAGTATPGVDYTPESGQRTIAAGELSATVVVSVIDDTLDEPTESFELLLSNPLGASLAVDRALGTLLDDDDPPALLTQSGQIVEGDTGSVTLALPLALSTESGFAVEVAYLTQPGTAEAGVDYVSRSGSLIFPVGATSASIEVEVLGDLLDEPAETFSLVLSNPQHVILPSSEIPITILDNDGLPQIAVAAAEVTEGNTGITLLSVPVSLSVASGSPVEVTFETIAGSALPGQDYIAASGTLSFPAGSTEGSVELQLLGDLLDELDETFVLRLSDPLGATLGSSEAIITLLDDDDPPQLSIEDLQIDEGNPGTPAVLVPVTLSAPSSFEIAVDFHTTGGTAQPGVDYVEAAGTLLFGPGTTEAMISLQVIGDLIDEPNETLSLVLLAPVMATLGDDLAQLTLIDDDEAPIVLITGGSVEEGDEGIQVLTLPVTLSSASGYEVQVEFLTLSGTAEPGVDYVQSSGTVLFPIGQTVSSVDFEILGDLLPEPDETFGVGFFEPVNATLEELEVEATILDDDEAIDVIEIPTLGDYGRWLLIFGMLLAALFSLKRRSSLAGGSWAGDRVETVDRLDSSPDSRGERS